MITRPAPEWLPIYATVAIIATVAAAYIVLSILAETFILLTQ